MSLLSAHPTLSTAVLRNTLLQLQRTPDYSLTPETLTQPIHTRRNQILEFPTTRLHMSGQQAALGMTGGIVTGVGISWAGWLGWLLGSGEGLLGFMGMEAGTAVGVGILSAVASIRWTVGKWEKSKKRWWQDWKRVAEGMDRDLKVCVPDFPDFGCKPLHLCTRPRFIQRCADKSSRSPIQPATECQHS